MNHFIHRISRLPPIPIARKAFPSRFYSM